MSKTCAFAISALEMHSLFSNLLITKLGQSRENIGRYKDDSQSGPCSCIRDFGINYRTNLLLKLVLFGTGSKIHVCNFYLMSKHLYLGIGNELIIFKYVSYEENIAKYKGDTQSGQ